MGLDIGAARAVLVKSRGHFRAGFDEFFDRELRSRGISLSGKEKEVLEMDIDLNAQGIAFAAARARKKGQVNNG